MVQINIKLKTIEGGDSLVTVDDEILLSDFRHHVENATQITKDRQRILFRGRALVDDAKTLKNYGIEDDMAVHVVSRVTPPQQPAEPPASSQASDDRNATVSFDEQHRHNRVNGHNVIIGTVPLERTSLFGTPAQTLALMQELLEQLGTSFNITSEASLQDVQNADDFIINVILRGRRESVFDSPAREHFEQLRRDMKKLTWMVATVKLLFLRHVDELLAGNFVEPDSNESCQILANLLQGMHCMDSLAVDELRSLHNDSNSAENALLELADAFDAWRLPDDDDHLQQMDDNITMRHIVSVDVLLLLNRLSVIDNDIFTQLMTRFTRVLSVQHTFEVCFNNCKALKSASYTARLLNCFMSAVSRVQHLRAHVYHNVSDFGIHVDANPNNRIFPQYVVYERDEPPEASIMFVFHHPRNSGGSNTTSAANLVRNSRNVLSSSAGGSYPVMRQRIFVPGNISSNVNAPLSGGLGNSAGGRLRGMGFGGGVQGFRIPTSLRTQQPSSSSQTSSSNAATSSESTAPRFPLFPGGIQLPEGPSTGSGQRDFVSEPMDTSEQQQSNASSGASAGALGNVGGGIHLGGRSFLFPGGIAQQRVGVGRAGSGGGHPSGSQQSHQQSSIGQALSEFMSLASRFHSFRPGAQQSDQNRSNPAVNNAGESGPTSSTHFRRSISTTYLGGGSRGENNEEGGGPVPQPPPQNPTNAASSASRPPSRSGFRVMQQAGPTTSNTTALLGWRQLPATSANAIFIGQRPPMSVPMYTSDPYLPCASRHLRSFKSDARHNDFWNDPQTIASGHRLKEPFTSSSSATPTEDNNVEADSTTSRTAPLARHVDVRVNNNGEAVFIEEQAFRDYVTNMLEHVVNSMAEFQPTILGGGNDGTHGSNTQSINDGDEQAGQVYGYAPVIGRSLSGLGGFNATEMPPSFEGIISFTAEIPFNANFMSNNSSEGAGQSATTSNSSNNNNRSNGGDDSANRGNNSRPTQLPSRGSTHSGEDGSIGFDLDEMD